MPQTLTIRQVPEGVHQALKQRAAFAGRSVEAEVRQILAETCLQKTDADWAAGLRERAQRRTGETLQTDSALLIREDRDGRDR